MLDRTTTVETTPTLYGFTAWLERQPADAHYEYSHCDVCAISQYCESIGTTYRAAMEAMGATFNLWNGEITSPKPWTFGAAAERARAYEE